MQRHQRRWLNLSAGLAAAVIGGHAAIADVDSASAFEPDSMRRVEVRANTYEDNRQQEQAVAVAPDGRMIVVWGSRRQEKGNYGVFAQALDPLGRRIGTEFHVNAYYPSHQQEPDVAFAPDGTAWIVWESYSQDGSMGSIIARRFALGETGLEALGEELIVNQTTQGHQGLPAVTVNDRGVAMVTWHTPEAGRSVAMARLLGADGPIGDEFRLTGMEGGSELTASTTALPGGRFAAVWSYFGPDKAPAGVFARTIEADGTFGEPFRVSVADGRDHVEPSIDADDSGRFVVAWMAAREGDAGFDVMARRFDAEGAPLGEAFVAANESPWWKSGAAVAMAGDGRFVISYNREGEKEMDPTDMEQRPETPRWVMARAFDADGRSLGEAFEVTRLDKHSRRLDAGANNRRVVWSDLDQLVFAWHGTIDDDKRAVGLTLLAPAELECEPPIEVPQMAAGLDLDDASMDAIVPPIFDPNAVPVEREVGVAAAGPDYGFQVFGDTGWTPPDPDLAVGPNHIVGVVNGGIAFFTKDGVQTYSTTLNDFWRELGSDDFVFDPVAVWDHFAQRFVIACSEHDGSADLLCFAVSDDADPNGTWHKYRWNTDHIGGFIDFQNLGFDDEAYYITADYFSGGGNNIHIIDKAKALVGDPITLGVVRTSSSIRSLGSINTYDADAPAQYFATSWSGSSTRISLDAITDPLGNPQRHTFNLTVPFFTDPPDASQRGTSFRLDTVDVRIKNGVYRNGSLWLVHTIGEESTARVRWYEIEMNGWPTSGQNPTLKQSGTLDFGPGQHSWFPDISVDDEGNAVITCSRSSSNDYAYIARQVRRSFDVLGEFRESIALQEGEAPDTSGRWGDYSGIDEDPAAPGVFWSHNEYPGTPQNTWKTWTGRVDVHQSMVMDNPGALHRGQDAVVTVRSATSGGRVYLLYTFAGQGSTYVPQLDVTVDLQSPKLATSATADSSGVATFVQRLPNNAPLRAIYLQAAELGNRSNVIVSQIEP